METSAVEGMDHIMRVSLPSHVDKAMRGHDEHVNNSAAPLGEEMAQVVGLD